MFFGLMLFLAVEYIGLQYDLPPLKAIRFTTLLNYGLFVLVLARHQARGMWAHMQTKIFATFIAVTMLSVMWAVVQTYAFASIQPFIDYTITFVLTASLVDRRSRFDRLAWTLILVSAVIVARNLDKLSSSLRLGGFRAGYFLGDNNDFAWGCVVMLPLILFLAFGRRPFLTRLAGLAGATICLVGIVGTGSRGGTLGLAAALLFYWLIVSKRKLMGAIVLAIVVCGVLLFAPSSYIQRMHTVETYEEDSSAQARLQLWGASLKMARDYPLGVGAGNFSSAYGRFYMPPPETSGITWSSQRWLSAHSIYFRVIGEYGYGGGALLLWLLIANIATNLKSHKRLLALGNPATLPAVWPALIATSVVGFSIAGIFLGGLMYPHLFILSGLTVRTKLMVEDLESAAGRTPALPGR
jgi:putative inorganic carbon (hco3(-)) transporter